MLRLYICGNYEQKGSKLINAIRDIINNKRLYIEEPLIIHEIKCINALYEPSKEQEKIKHIFIIDPLYQNGMNGLEIAKLIRQIDELAYIIFISDSLECLPYCIKSLIRPSGFIWSGSYRYELEEILDLISKEYERSKDIDNRICIVVNGKKIFLPIADVLFFTAVNKKIACNLIGGKIIEFYGSLGELHAKYFKYFFRCHHGFLINVNRINEVTRGINSLKIEGYGQFIPISKKYRPSVKNMFVNLLQDIETEVAN